MFIFKSVLSVALLTSMSLASAASVTCTMKNVKNGKKDVLSLPVKDDTFDQSVGLEIPDNSYNFSMYMRVNKTNTYDLEIMFADENDEVGNIYCEFDPKKIGAVVCKDDLFDMDDVKLFSFSCKVAK